MDKNGKYYVCDVKNCLTESSVEQTFGEKVLFGMGGIENLPRHILEEFFDYQAFGRTVWLSNPTNFEEDESGSIWSTKPFNKIRYM